MPTSDPLQITDPSQIPPGGAQPEGLSPQGLVEVSCGTIPGDIDAQPAAKELLNSAADTGGSSNADYIYQQVSAIYGGVDLPDLDSRPGSKVKSVVFVSGSPQGGYGAFHTGDVQTQFDRLVLDSLNASGNYSDGSGLASARVLAAKVPHLFAPHRAPASLSRVVGARAPRLRKRAAIGIVHRFFRRSKVAPGGAASLAAGGRQYLSTALFAAEITECFQTLTRKAAPGRTDGEAVSRVVAFKLAPEIARVPGFNAAVTQQWWTKGHADFVTVNSATDQSIAGNGCGVMFLLFINDYLGIALDEMIRCMPATGGAPLGDTYVGLLQAHPELAAIAGSDASSAFRKMVSLLQTNVQGPDGALSLPADGNPFPAIEGAQQGGLFAR